MWRNIPPASFARASVLPCHVQCPSPGLATTAFAFVDGEKILGLNAVGALSGPRFRRAIMRLDAIYDSFTSLRTMW